MCPEYVFAKPRFNMKILIMLAFMAMAFFLGISLSGSAPHPPADKNLGIAIDLTLYVVVTALVTIFLIHMARLRLTARRVSGEERGE
ncbi:hypothetical protein SAMN04488090_1682 [Siphonobacter aquaeclarae]|uniref:Uncharacterized protein n=2 Tax=Siphonobacter aquaeclarae TaxID=563176 RepID=A0A1G9MPB6_9BACT|nr:hypothetical protein SAMN04488090_1682 [Siphonobacter aquaeclarae]